MQELENLVKTTLGEIERILSTKTIIGESLKVNDTTVIPLTRVGFGFGMGYGTGKDENKEKNEGKGSGLGGGGGVQPIALIIADKDGVRLEPITNKKSGFLEKLTETIPSIMDKVNEKKSESKKEG